jgi:hypothetical protein
MDIQADIKWIQQELNNVSDPDLIAAFQSLLAYKQELKFVSDFDAAYERAEKDKSQGNVSPHEDVRKKYEKWL